MAIIIDNNIRRFADALNITSSRLNKDYGLSTIDEIIESEAEKGNYSAVRLAQRYASSPEKLIKLFRLTNVENRFSLIRAMDDNTREKLLPFLEKEELLMGMYFFKQEALLRMLMYVDIEELVAVALEAFPFQQIIMMFKEEDLAKFFLHDDIEKNFVLEQLKKMPPEMMEKFLDSITGQPAGRVDAKEIFKNLEELSDDKFKKFMSMVDTSVQRQLVFQMSKEKPEHLCFFENKSYVEMLNTLMKNDMIKPMIMLSQETMIDMLINLTPELLSVVAAQIDEKKFAVFLQDGHMELLESAMIM